MNKRFTFFLIISVFLVAYPCLLKAQRNSLSPLLISKTENLNTKTPNDTLLPGNLPNVVTPVYVLLPSDNGGFILGNNGWNDKCKCQQFQVSYYYHIEGAIYWFAYKKADSAENVRFAIWNMDGNTGTTSDTSEHTCPGTLIISITDTTSRIDTSSNRDQAYIVSFPFPVFVQDDYCIGFDMSSMMYDTLALVSTASGQGGGLELVWEQWSSTNLWYTLQGAKWDSGSIDVDAMIFPIIDNTADCEEINGFMNGVMLGEPYPNPASGNINIPYSLEHNNSHGSILIMDLNGKVISTFQPEVLTQGKHLYTADISALQSGTYLCLFHSGKGRVARRFSIIK